MQDFQSIPGLAGRLFGGAVPPDPRRARAQCGGAVAAAAPEEVKCPRCESTNTKFCYYNNYNLSQPRHFCKSCRRYWTKGGVLRNVPVGGGCRKSKRSPAASASSASASGPTTAASCSSSSTDAVKSANHPALAAPASYSSEDTSLPTATPKTVTASATSTSNAATAMSTSPDDPFATDFLPPPAPIFADPAAAFTYLFAAPPPPLPAFGFPPEPKTEGVASAFVEQASEPANAAAAIAADMTILGWQPAAVDAGIFDLAGAAGDASPAYWNPGGWTDPDPTIYLP